MSGGVDSSAAAALLHAEGHEVVGVTLHLWDAPEPSRIGRCCAPEDRDDARRTCDFLGVPHYVFDERVAFRKSVVDPFLDTALAGQTPLPCASCNQSVKLARLIELADQLGASQVATGHYARIQKGADGRPRLLRGVDHDKDQSYFLYGTPESMLQRLRFPLGEMVKTEARDRARALGVPNWAKPDSQELCFLPDAGLRDFVERERPGAQRPGNVVDEQGEVLGRHEGVAGFTVGQRRGLGLGGGPTRHVLRIIAERDEVVAGPPEALACAGLRAERTRWTLPPPPEPFRAQVRVRYRHEPAPALVTARNGHLDVSFEQPQRAVAPGQAAVVYDGDEVLGGGTIASAASDAVSIAR
jgi:tRNA-specific 2-thiouridylase